MNLSVAQLHQTIVAAVVLLSIGGADTYLRFVRRSDRIAARHKALWVWRMAIGIAALAVSTLSYEGSAKSLAQAIGFFVGLASGGIAIREYFTKSSRRLKVTFLAKANNGFTRMIASGARERLGRSEQFFVTEVYPDSDASETSRGVLAKIQAGAFDEADAAIIVLGEITNDLRQQIYRLIVGGTQLVLCDAIVERDYFYERNVEPPSFVGTDFIEGGRLVAQAIHSRWQPTASIVVFCGPNFNGPAYERAREVLYTLNELQSGRDIVTVFTTEWSSAHIVQKMTQDVLPRLEDPVRSGSTSPDRRTVHVYCGNDESAIVISQWVMVNDLKERYEFQLYGFDGLRDGGGELAIRAWPHIVFTVDTQPNAIGRLAASVVFDKVAQPSRRASNNMLLKPTGVFIV